MSETNTTEQVLPQLLRVAQVCTLLSIGRTKAYELINDGRLDAVKIDGATRITSRSVNSFLESLTHNP